jgi:hypothetical protein
MSQLKMHRQWNAETVAKELSELGLEKYGQAFIDQEIRGDMLSDLTNDHLREMGLTIGSRIILMRWIKSLDPEYVDEIESVHARVPCPHCHRRFATDRIKYHMKICGNVKRRMPFDARRVRGRNWPSSPTSPKSSSSDDATPASPRTAEQHRYIREHERLVELLRMAKGGRRGKRGQREESTQCAQSGQREDVDEKRLPCDHCGRKFNPTSLKRHYGGCLKLKIKARPKYDSRAMRLKGTEAAKFYREEGGESEANRKDYRNDHETLRQVIRTARQLHVLRRAIETE